MDLKQLKWIFLSIIVVLVGCKDSPSSIRNNASCNGSECSNNQEGQLPPTPSKEDKWIPIQKGMDGRLTTPFIQNFRSIRIDPVAGTAIIVLPLESVIMAEMEVELPNYPGAKLVVMQEADGTNVIAFHLPLSYLMKGVDFGDPQRLPSGDPLPAIAGGELPAMRVGIPASKVKLFVYIGVEVFAIYVEVPFDPYIRLTFPIRQHMEDPEAKGDILGYFTTIPKKAGYSGGFFLSTEIPPEIARQIDEILE